MRHPISNWNIRKLTSNDVVESAILGQDFRIGEQQLKQGTEIFLRNNCSLSSYLSREGQVVGSIILKEGATVSFDEHGTLEAIYFTQPNLIQGYLLEANSMVNFYSSGGLFSGMLNENTIVNGLHLRAHSVIELYQSGTLKSVEVSEESQYENIYVTKSEGLPAETTFWPNGKIRQATLSRITQIGNEICDPGRAHFDQSGNVTGCSYHEVKRQTTN